MGKKYGILAGNPNRPEFVERGNLEKGTGQTVPEGDIVKTMAKRGSVGIPNYTEVWGVRLDEKGNVPTTPLEVKDAKYKGQIKELKWGAIDGNLIICRYLKGYNSIDLQYQNLVLGAKDNIRDEDDVHYIVFQTGDNYYDVESDRYLVQFLRCHYLNESSKSKNPEEVTSFFRDLSEETTVTQQTKVIDSKFEALSIVREAAQDNSNQKIKNLYDIMQGTVDETIKENDLFRYFMLFADEKPEAFMKRIDAYKLEVSNAISMAESFDMIDLTNDGIILLGENKGKKEIVAEGIPAKGEKMKDWIMDNYLSPEGYIVAFKLKQFTEKIK